MSPYRDAPRYLHEDDIITLFSRIVALTNGGGDTTVGVTSQWVGNLRWARNWITTSGDTRNHQVTITRTIRGASGTAHTNALDDAALTQTIQTAERMVPYHAERADAWPPPGLQRYASPTIWSDATYHLDASQRSTTARTLLESLHSAAQQKAETSTPLLPALQTAGYLEVAVIARAVRNTQGLAAYCASTRAEYSVTVRNTQGTGSGWAGLKHYDWNAIDAAQLTARATEKCVQSTNPKAVEPGRYTAVLEPQAVYDLMYGAVSFMDRESAERNRTAYTLFPGQSKIGQKIFDERITISTSPVDVGGEYIPFDDNGYPYRPVTWVENGVLKELAYDFEYAVTQLREASPLPNPFAFHVHGGQTSLDQMIATTKRGLLVTRFSRMRVLDKETLLMTGYTRDGIWLIENGTVTYPVKNFRVQESPMFAFNNVVQISPAVPVFATPPALVPAMKVDDFLFASLIDAI